MAKQKLITTRIAAEILGFTQDYVRQLCFEGKIKALKAGHDWIIDEKNIKNIRRKRKESGNGSSQ
jgi:excisionase family DNA binding protein